MKRKAGLKMKASDQLVDEHKGILLMLDIMSKMTAAHELNHEHLDRIIEFLTIFVDKCHHGKEEDILFPVYESKGIPRENGPIGIMLYEHKLGRGFIKEIIDAFAQLKDGDNSFMPKLVKAINSYATLLKAHIQKENNILYPMGDRLISDQLQTELLGKFEELEEERIGAGKHEEFHELLKKLKGIYLH
jgi:hemerythrin-like domain-containing protein